MTDTQTTKFKAVLQCSAVLNEDNIIVVDTKAHFGENIENVLDIGTMLKLHAAIIETSDRAAVDMLAKHSSDSLDYRHGLDFYHDALRQVVKATRKADGGDDTLVRELADSTPGLVGELGQRISELQPVLQAAVGVLESARNTDGTMSRTASASALAKLRSAVTAAGREV
jgi:hypothetical protein